MVAVTRLICLSQATDRQGFQQAHVTGSVPKLLILCVPHMPKSESPFPIILISYLPPVSARGLVQWLMLVRHVCIAWM